MLGIDSWAPQKVYKYGFSNAARTWARFFGQKIVEPVALLHNHHVDERDGKKGFFFLNNLF
jgi:hypothetical protein